MKNNEFKFTKQNNFMIPVVAIVSTAIIFITLIITIVAGYVYNAKHNAYVSMTQFTYCMQTIIESSHKVGKTVDADKAKEICKELSPNK